VCVCVSRVAGLYQKALAWQGVELELDEVECILANLIYRKYVKGYISHQHRVLVVSKVEPFPELRSATAMLNK
jgi:nuclear mRNA export protein PCID2/THP1